MKRSPLQRRTPIARGSGPKRKKWMSRVPKKRKRYREERKDIEFLEWVHTQPCRMSECFPSHRCSGRIEADHQGPNKGIALKDSDRTTVPMCSGGHRERTEWRGQFRGWSKVQMREWCDGNVAEMNDRFLAEEGKL